MWSDVIDLRDFYDSSLGQTARRMIRRQIRDIWPDSIVAVGAMKKGAAIRFLEGLEAFASR